MLTDAYLTVRISRLQDAQLFVKNALAKDLTRSGQLSQIARISPFPLAGHAMTTVPETFGDLIQSIRLGEASALLVSSQFELAGTDDRAIVLIAYTKAKHTIMERKHFILGALALFPITILARIKTQMRMRAEKGFKVSAGDARFGEHYKMKGVTLNNLDIKISSADTNGDLAVFEQTGLTPKGGPPLHIHPFQDEWFHVIEGEYLFQVGEDNYQLRAGDTIFLPRRVQHAFVQLTVRGKMIVSYLPAGKMEAFFKVTDKWTLPPTKEDIAKVFEDHDMKVVGAPLKVE